MSATPARHQSAIQVFISHAREDQPLVERIVRGLTFGGRVRVHTDQMVPVGGDWRSELRRALEAAHVFIVIGSPASARSEFVLQEIGGAWALGKPIVVVTPEGEVEWVPPIESSAYRRAELEQPSFAERLLAELTQSSAEGPE